jgi:hypothetical protein
MYRVCFGHTSQSFDCRYNIVSKGVLDHLRIVFVVFVVLFLTVVIDYKQLNDVRYPQHHQYSLRVCCD